MSVRFWKIITMLGDDKFYVLALPFIYLAYDRKKGLKLAYAVLTALWLVDVLKNALMIPRPPREKWLVEVSGYSFPSGHACGTTVFWGSLAILTGNLVVACIGLVLVPLVSISRVVLNVHYPQDVIGGVILGIIILAFLTAFEKKIIKMPEKASYPLLALGVIIPPLMPGGIGYSGKIIGALIGMHIGHKAYGEDKGKPGKVKKIVAGVLGSATLLAFYFAEKALVNKLALASLTVFAVHVVLYSIAGFVIAYVYPKLFKY